MSTTNLDRLPNELLLNIATQCDALSALSLSATCRRVRSACYSAVLFKRILVNSQRDRWDKDSLDIQSINRRCGADVSAWARYAVADEKAYLKAQEAARIEADREAGVPPYDPVTGWDPLDVLGHSEYWLAELVAVRHPFMYCFLWVEIERTTDEEFAWCAAVASLVHRGLLGSKWGSVDPHIMLIYKDHYIDAPLTTCLQALRVTINNIAEGLQGPNVAPHYLPIPQWWELETYLGAVDPGNPLPLPFANGWAQWYQRRNKDLVAHLTTGVWQGYYIYSPNLFDWGPVQLDAPMKNVKFRRLSDDDPGAHGGRVINLIAEGCRDGIGGFTVTGTVKDGPDGGPVFSGRKDYLTTAAIRSAFGWTWELMITEFGLIGYWGDGPTQDGPHLGGTVWLWKTACGEEET